VSKTLGVALVGQKFMGRAHANAWGQVGRFFTLPVVVRAEIVAGRDARALEAFARRFGFRRFTTDWRDLVEDDAVRLVDLATPNHLHAEQAVAMLEAGKHVACEKPLAGTLAAARVMRDAAARNRRRARTFVWFNYRRIPAIGAAFRLVRKGALGGVRHVRARYLQSWGDGADASAWRFDPRQAGSGAHGDLNAHMVDLARFLTGDEIVEVNGAVARTFVRGRRVDDAVAFLATFRRGATASFEASRVATGHLNDHAIEIEGARGALRFSFQDMNALWRYDGTEARSTGGWKRIEATAAKAHPWIEAWWPEGHGLGYEHTFVNMAADVLRAAAGRAPEVPLPDFADAFETQRVLEAALLSARNRCAIPLEEVP
jgi:predicted dehydrogenase